MTQEASYDQMLRRFEHLKRMYFSSKSDPMYDEEGNQIPSVYPLKVQIVEMFQSMGVQIPTSPKDTMKPIPKRVQK